MPSSVPKSLGNLACSSILCSTVSCDGVGCPLFATRLGGQQLPPSVPNTVVFRGARSGVPIFATTFLTVLAVIAVMFALAY